MRTARSTYPLGDNMTDTPPLMEPGENFALYADRLAHWAAEDPTDRRFVAVGTELSNITRVTARKSSMTPEIERPCSRITADVPRCWLYGGECAVDAAAVCQFEVAES